MLFNLFKWLAAAYLVYLGWRALRARPMNLEAIDGTNAPVARSAWRAFVIGFVTNGLNPKATLFFLSLFTVVISPDTPLLVQAGYGLYLAGATALWFCWWPGCSAEAACGLALRAWGTGSIG